MKPICCVSVTCKTNVSVEAIVMLTAFSVLVKDIETVEIGSVCKLDLGEGGFNELVITEEDEDPTAHTPSVGESAQSSSQTGV